MNFIVIMIVVGGIIGAVTSMFNMGWVDMHTGSFNPIGALLNVALVTIAYVITNYILY
jgi:hypothetical protein